MHEGSLERMRSCMHMPACERVGRLASLAVWTTIGHTYGDGLAEALMCDSCGEWRKDELRHRTEGPSERGDAQA